MQSIAKVKPSRKFPDLQYILQISVVSEITVGTASFFHCQTADEANREEPYCQAYGLNGVGILDVTHLKNRRKTLNKQIMIGLRGYKTFFMLNTTEHQISTPLKNKNTEK